MNFHKWVEWAKPGDKVVYHRGYLLWNRDGHGKLIDRELGKIAFDAYRAYEKKQVVLVQRKRGNHDYEYVAVKL